MNNLVQVSMISAPKAVFTADCAAGIVPALHKGTMLHTQARQSADLHNKLDGARRVAQLADVGDVSLLDGVQGGQSIL